MLGFFVLFALAAPFPALYVFAVLDISRSSRSQGRRFQPSISGERGVSQQRMQFAESSVPASVVEFQAVILAGYGNA